MSVVAFNSHTKLFEAIEDENLERLIAYLDTGMSPNQTDETQMSLLMVAACKGSIEIADELLRRGALVDHKEEMGETALCWAVRAFDLPMIIRLLKAAASPLVCNEFGENLLHIASDDPILDDPHRQMKIPAVLSALVSAGVLLHQENEFGRTPLCQALHAENLLAADVLIDLGADLKNEFKPGRDTPLHTAAATGDLPVTKWLLDRHVPLDIQDQTGLTAWQLLNAHPILKGHSREQIAQEQDCLMASIGLFAEDLFIEEPDLIYYKTPELFEKKKKGIIGVWTLLKQHGAGEACSIGADVTDSLAGRSQTSEQGPIIPASPIPPARQRPVLRVVK